MEPIAIVRSLETGRMMGAGQLLSPREKREVAVFLTGRLLSDSTTDSSLLKAGACDSEPPLGDLDSGPRWNGWGVDLANSRYQPAAHARLDVQNLASLRLRWAFGLPGAIWARAQPTVAGGRVFIGSPDGRVYALDEASGCILWIRRVDGGVRTAILLAALPIGDTLRHLAIFGDLEGTAYALDAYTGALVWESRLDSHPHAVITAAPQLYDGRLFFPVSSKEQWAAKNPRYPCCRFRGSVVALDVATGRRLWKTHTIPDSTTSTGRNTEQVMRWGPSGAAVWATPTVDTTAGVLYIGTGNGYSGPPTRWTDAIMALDLGSGAVRWVRQMTEDDIWNMSCASRDRTNCPNSPGPDFDFGSSLILVTRPDGGRILIAAQKSGVVHALDPDDEGAILWQARLGKGGGRGEVKWGPATDGERVYVALSVQVPDRPDLAGGLYALRLADGSVEWFTSVPTDSCSGKPDDCNQALSSAVTATQGVVFAGSRDGFIRAYSTDDGTILWEYDTVRDYETVNGVAARGGSINAAGATLVAGTVFVNSGYGAGGMAGNVLLAFGSGID